MREIQSVLIKAEEHIKMGRFSEANKLLSQIGMSDLPRKHLLNFSNLSRRCGNLQRALKALGPLVRTPKLSDDPPSDNEIADYAYSLNQGGLSLESEKLLRPLREKNNTSAFLFSALLCFTQWDYPRAETFLKRYIQQPDISPYKQKIGESNLVSSLIFQEKWDEAQNLLSEIQKFADEKNLPLLKNLCIEQSAEIYILKGQGPKARPLLARAKKQAADSGVRLNIWLEKWQNILVAENSNANKGLQTLASFREKAFLLQDWETCRDIDFHGARLFGRRKLYEKLFFGTPYSSYRKRVKALELGPLPPHYNYLLNSSDRSREPFKIDISRQELSLDAGSTTRKLRTTDWKLLEVLSSDFYKPFKLGELFGVIFESEFYNPFHSPNRVHQLVHRFNNRMKEAEVPVKIVNLQGHYSLQPSSNISIGLINKDLKSDFNDPKLLKLRQQTPREVKLKAKDIQNAIGLPTRSTHRWIKDKVNEGSLLKLDSGKNTAYIFSEDKKVA